MWFQARWLIESFQKLVDISCHINIDISKLIIPFQGKFTVKFASDVGCCCVFCLECVVQVAQVGTRRVLDTEIIDDEGE